MSRPDPADTPIVFCSDRTFIPYAAVATLSLIETNDFPVLVYWVVRPEDEELARDFRARMPAGSHRIEILTVDDSPFSGWGEHFHVSRGAYIRLLIPDLLPHRRALYLDGDVLALSGIRPLLESDLGGCPIGAVVNLRADELPPVAVCADAYVNSGVLLMDLDALRADGFFARCEAIYRNHDSTQPWMDQEVINVYAEGRKHLLAPRWNRQVRCHQTSDRDWQALVASGEAAIVHFLGAVKPWHAFCNPAIIRDWRRYADRLQLGPEHYLEMTTVKQAYFMSMMKEINEDFSGANELRQRIVARLLRQVPMERLRKAKVSYGLSDLGRGEPPAAPAAQQRED